jgi:non-ribosomal peptide synthetase component F
LAGWLVEKGVRPDAIVGIMMERSVEMISGILGILKSGGAYMPIEPEYPQERIDYMLKDSGAKILINKSEIRNSKFETNPNDKNTNDQNKNQHFGAVSVLDFEHLNFEFVSNFDIRISNFNSSNLAYLIYTSGSTQKNQGVMVEHGSIFNTIYYRKQEYKMGVDDRALQMFSFAFDGFLTSFTMVSGVPVVLLSGDEARILPASRNHHYRKNYSFICVPSLYRVIGHSCR